MGAQNRALSSDPLGGSVYNPAITCDVRASSMPQELRNSPTTPTERMAILELKAARGWSLVQAARVFLTSNPSICHYNPHMWEWV